MRSRRTSVLLLLGVSAVCAAIAAASLRTSSVAAEEAFDARDSFAFDARDSFAIFSQPASMSPPASALVGSRREELSADLSEVRLLASGLGRFESRLMAVPARGGRNVCYSLVGRTEEDPATTYCWAPKNPEAPKELAGKHFNVMGLEDRLLQGQVAVQLFGIAFDDVISLRAEVAGRWRALPLRSNGFYLDLPGVSHEDLGIVEATLSDGAQQVHNLQTGS